jgi:uncharacterized membrane protein (UPF0127 family)
VKKPDYTKGLAFFIVSTLTLWTLCAFILLGHTKGSCNETYRNDQKLTVNGHVLKAQIAKTETEKQKGLGGKACIPENQAMLFEFEKSSYYPFWMKDMKFPIDIVWIDSSKKVITVKSNVTPSTYPQTFVSGKPAQYVLELQENSSKKFNISEGSSLKFDL